MKNFKEQLRWCSLDPYFIHEELTLDSSSLQQDKKLFVITNSIIHMQGAIVNLFLGLVHIDQCHANRVAVSRWLKASGLVADVTDYGWAETSKRMMKGS